MCCATSRDPGVHVAARAHDGAGRHLAVPVLLRRAVPRRARGPIPIHVAGCTVLLVSVLCSFVYDSLGSAMFTVFIAIGLMARSDLLTPEGAW